MALERDNDGAGMQPAEIYIYGDLRRFQLLSDEIEPRNREQIPFSSHIHVVRWGLSVAGPSIDSPPQRRTVI